MLATDPAQQACGIGKVMLAAAERLAVERLAPQRLVMSVLTSRPELLAFYQRRGYRLTGQVSGYPLDAGVGQPRTPGLELLELEKPVAVAA